MNDRNTQTVIATFDNFQTAQQAANELTGLDIPRNAIDLHSNTRTVTAGQSAHGEHHEEGGFAGWWHRHFGSDDRSDDQGYYDNAIEGGHAVLSAQVPTASVDRAVNILNQHGAIDIEPEASASARTSSWPVAATVEGQPREGGSVPVFEEELKVGKRMIQRGGVRVYTRVVSQPVEEKVSLREEHVRVERRPADRELSPQESGRFQDQTIEVTEMAEEPVISKRARVKEEVVIDKETTERTEIVRENLRHTEVRVENLGRKEDYSDDYRRDFKTNYASSTGADYSRMEPAYRFGSSAATNPRYQGKTWEDVENDLRSDYQQNYPNSRWDEAKNAVRYGWDRVTRKR